MSRKKIYDEEGNTIYVEEEQSAGEMLQDVGSTMSSCGCLLTLLITIPIILILLGLLFF